MLERYDLFGVIGFGTNSYIFDVIQRSTREHVALKLIHTDRYDSRLHEIDMLQYLNDSEVVNQTDCIPELLDYQELTREEVTQLYTLISNSDYTDGPDINFNRKFYAYITPLYLNGPDTFDDVIDGTDNELDTYIEILILLLVLNKEGITHGDIGDDNFVYKKVNYARVYHFGDVIYIAYSPYVPVLIDWESAYIHQNDGSLKDLAALKSVFALVNLIPDIESLLEDITEWSKDNIELKINILNHIYNIIKLFTVFAGDSINRIPFNIKEYIYE